MDERADRPTRIMLVDDHALVLEGLSALIERERDMQVVATLTDGAALLDALQHDVPDVIVLDLELPGRDGLSCLQAIRQAGLPVKVVILSAFGDGATLQSAWEGGADGFALKTDPPRQTVATIRNVAQGQLVFPLAVRRALGSASPVARPLDQLTVRERAVLELMAAGLTNAQIAERLVVQESTVKFHLQNIFQKLGVANRTEAAQVYFRERQRRA
jgi:DNA-binding NarL/FixJ family response regulator